MVIVGTMDEATEAGKLKKDLPYDIEIGDTGSSGKADRPACCPRTRRYKSLPMA
jgi:hypothetical protein